MKGLNEYFYDTAEYKYLNEGLVSWFKAFFKKLKKSQNSRYNADTNKVEMYKVDTKKMKVQKEPVKLTDIDPETKEIISNEHTGFPIAAQILQNPNKFLKTKEHTFNPFMQCYFAQDGNKSYYVGLIMYDDNVTFIEGFKHILDVEPNLIVDNPSEVNKTMIEQFATVVKENDIKGFTCNVKMHPKLKTNLMNAGFKPSNTDKEIYVYNIK